jgi:hypothetical protein
MHLIDILMRKTKSSQILYLCLFFFFLSCFLFISQCFFVNFTPNSGKRREKCRESFQSLFPNDKLYYGSFLFFSFFFFFARIFILHYSSIVILYFSIFIFGAYVFSFCFGLLYIFFFCFLIFSSFTFYFISINSRKRQEKEFLFIVSQ